MTLLAITDGTRTQAKQVGLVGWRSCGRNASHAQASESSTGRMIIFPCFFLATPRDSRACARGSCLANQKRDRRSILRTCRAAYQPR